METASVYKVQKTMKLFCDANIEHCCTKGTLATAKNERSGEGDDESEDPFRRERKKDVKMKKEVESMVSRRVQRLRAEETQMHRDEILNDSAFTVGRYGGSLCSQQSINMADSPKAAFVQVILADPLSRYLRGMCVWGAPILSRARSLPDDMSTIKNQRKRE